MQVIDCFTTALGLTEKCINNSRTAERNIGQPAPINASVREMAAFRNYL